MAGESPQVTQSMAGLGTPPDGFSGPPELLPALPQFPAWPCTDAAGFLTAWWASLPICEMGWDSQVSQGLWKLCSSSFWVISSYFLESEFCGQRGNNNTGVPPPQSLKNGPVPATRTSQSTSGHPGLDRIDNCLIHSFIHSHTFSEYLLNAWVWARSDWSASMELLV